MTGQVRQAFCNGMFPISLPHPVLLSNHLLFTATTDSLPISEKLCNELFYESLSI